MGAVSIRLLQAGPCSANPPDLATHYWYDNHWSNVSYELVVEFDIPWDSSQVESYGDSFKAWGDQDFGKVWKELRKVLPHNQLAAVVIFLS
jgi:hypothetical protein